MLNQQELLSIFLSLMERQESEVLDFKRDAYNLSKEDNQLELVKDILCMYNTPREEDAHILLGVKEQKNRPNELVGIDPSTNTQHLDQSDLQRLFLEKFRVEPFPEFRIEILQYEGKSFGIITIPVKRVGPCKVVNGNGEKLKSGSHIYFRRGPSNDITRSPEETYEIMRWFQGDLAQPVFSQATSQWDQFLEAACINITSGFDLSRKYILVVSPFRNENVEILSVLSEIPASVVLDFDPYSDLNGLLYAVKGRLKRSLHTLVKRDRPTVNPEGTTYWFFARGLEGREGTLETGDHKAWRRIYTNELGEQLKSFAKAMNPSPFTCIALWYQDSHLIRHLKSALESMEQAFENAIEFVIVTKYPGEFQELADEFDAKLIDINLHQLCSGLQVSVSSGVGVEANEYLIPSSSNAPIPLNSDDRKWLEEELEIIYLNTGATAPDLNEPVGRRFLCGAEITWHELSLHCDINREKTEKVKRQVEAELSRRRAWRVNLYHAEFCRGSSLIPNEEMLELVRRAFIYRNNLDVLGTERVAAPALQSFSQLLQDIPLAEGRLETLRQLIQLYPDEAHIWAHLGRFYASQLKNYIQALECVEQAISLTNGKDHVLHHMKGMVMRYHINSLVEEKSNVQTVVELVKVASSSFEDARKLSPDDEHGYISEVQLLAKILDYAGTQHPNGVLSYLSTPGIDPFLLDSLERAEDLLEQVRRNREGQGEPSPLEVDCRAKLDALYGRHERALQTWDSLLSRKDSYHPPLRRQIIWTHLARHERSWNKLPVSDLQRIRSLLEENLQEEPSNDKDLRLWVQAVRWSKYPPSLESVIERVSYWKANSGRLDSVYYLYLLYVLSALQGSAQAKDNAERYMEECRQMARFRRNRTNSFEWLGSGSGMNSLVHHSELGQWKTDIEFWERTDRLVRVQGRVNKVDAPQQGYIEIKGGLLVFYVPARSNHSRSRSENQPVDFYLGFSYDGLRAWEVRDLGKAI